MAVPEFFVSWKRPMTLFPDRQIPEIPEPQESDVKEVFAFFGLCVFNAQVLEQGLTNLAVGLRARGVSRLTNKDFDDLFDKIGRKTLGWLIGDVRRYINVSSELEDALAEALRDRNYVTHRFFVVHDIDFMSERGRMHMIDELRQITRRIQSVDREIESLTHSLWEQLGLTADIVQKELERMKAEAKREDFPS